MVGCHVLGLLTTEAAEAASEPSMAGNRCLVHPLGSAEGGARGFPAFLVWAVSGASADLLGVRPGAALLRHEVLEGGPPRVAAVRRESLSGDETMLITNQTNLLATLSCCYGHLVETRAW